MNCQQVRRHWDLFHDSEGEADLHWQVNEHLRQCPDCAEWFARQSALEETLVQVLQAEAVPTGAVWERIERELAPVPSVSRRVEAGCCGEERC